MNTIEGNKLIAEFMGWKYSKSGRTVRKNNQSSPYRLKDIHYHSSWDWLMPVVEKMSTIHYGWDNMETPYDDCCYPRTFGMLNAEGKPMVRFNSSQVFTADTLIEATWFAVVDFIQWYNNQTPTNK